MSQYRQGFRESSELVEYRAEIAGDIVGNRSCAEQLLAFGEVPVAEILHATQGTDQMALRRLLSNREERVRRSTQCRHDYDRSLLEPPFNNRCGALDCLRVADGGAPELLYNQRHGSGEAYRLVAHLSIGEARRGVKKRLPWRPPCHR